MQTVVIVGGLASQKQERLLRGRPDIVIATPGRLWELVQEGDNYLSTLSKIKYVLVILANDFHFAGRKFHVGLMVLVLQIPGN